MVSQAVNSMCELPSASIFRIEHKMEVTGSSIKALSHVIYCNVSQSKDLYLILHLNKNLKLQTTQTFKLINIK